MPTDTKARRGRKPENTAEIRVRIDAKTKDRAERLFRRQGLSTSDGMRMLINRAIKEKSVWLAHETSSHIPNAESRKAIEEALAGGGEEMTLADLRRQWNEP